MKIIGITMVKNEADIIEVFVRHNLKFLDALIIMENMSTDNTKEILKKLQNERLPIVIIDDPIIEYKQSNKMTNLAKSVAEKFNPDYIIPIDADEFILINDIQQLQEELSELSEDGIGLLQRPTYLSTKIDSANEVNILKRMNYRTADYSKISSKIIIPKHIFSKDDFIIAQGNHDVEFGNKAGINHVTLKSIKLAHYPIRSKKQAISKSVIGWLSYLCDSNLLDGGQGWHWKYIYDKIVNGEDLDDDEFYKLQKVYLSEDMSMEDIVFDPILLNYEIELKYAKLIENSVFTNVIKTAEQMARVINNSRKSISLLNSFDLEIDYNYGIDQNGAFPSKWHECNFYFDQPAFKYIYDILSPESVLDIGCGLGAYINAYKNWGAKEVVGVEGNEMGEKFLVPGALVTHNMEKPLDLNRKFDLVICTEVIEHIKNNYEDNVIKSIANHAKKMIIFSGAQPIQKGVHHVNCRSVSYWMKKWQKEGWSPLSFESLAFRLLANLIWLKHNTLILVPSNQVNKYTNYELHPRKLLTEFDDLWENFHESDIKTELLKKWPPQKPSIYNYTLIGENIWTTVPNDFKLKLKELEVIEYICDLFNKYKRILIYGAGTHTLNLLRLLETHNKLNNVMGIIDSDASKRGKEIHGLNIYFIKQVKDLNCDTIIISSFSYENEIYESIKTLASGKVKIKTIYDKKENKKEIFDTIMKFNS